jgi:putative radical SAM enzyme (TIGR03279 family)
VVELIEPGGIAAGLGLEPGDEILQINGNPVRDFIDFRFFEADEELAVAVRKKNGEEWLLEIEKDMADRLGVDFASGGIDRIIRCHNKCAFCFVDQMPPGMRETLYIKDDDYRLSFLSGNFITLTNLDDRELQRIAGQRLSPLYISVHTTNPQLRERMLGNRRAGRIMEQLRYLAEAGIKMHVQMVLCPGVNDGPELEQTLRDLLSLWPAVSSAAVVPVGITGRRNGLRPFTSSESDRLLAQVERWQKNCLARIKYPFLFASDEFYLLAGWEIPPTERYVDFPQTENGVGLTRLFLDEWQEVKANLPRAVTPLRKVTMVTGFLGRLVMEPVVAVFNGIEGLHISLKVVPNRFFGEQVTVAGLLTGSDLMRAINPGEAGELLVLPEVMLKKDEPVFLDDVTLPELSEHLGVKVAAVKNFVELTEVLLN